MEKTREQIRSYYAGWFRINKLYYSFAQRYGIQDTTLFMLYIIKENKDGCTQRQICERMILPKQTVSLAILTLEKSGIVYQMPKKEDRRHKVVKFTNKGKVYADKILTELEDAEYEAYSQLLPEEKQAITQGISALANALEKSFFKSQEK